MNILLVENESGSITNFTKLAKKAGANIIDISLKLPIEKEELKRFLGIVNKEMPDVIVIDIALDETEEKLIDDVSLESTIVTDDLFSGFKYCTAIVRERWKIPIVFLTRVDKVNVTRAAGNIGADLILSKSDTSGHILAQIDNLVKSRKTTHDQEFYWKLRSMMDEASTWQKKTISKALDRFFLHESSVKRFSLFSASLKIILSPFFPKNKDAEKKMMLGLVKSQVLLSLVDPRLRDHVKHTGNVFWLGYYLLHNIKEFNDPKSLKGYNGAVFDSSGPLTERDQLLYSWTLAALFHDYGYINERQNQLAKLIEDIIPDITFKQTHIWERGNWTEHLNSLKSFVKKLYSENHFLYHYIDNAIPRYGRNTEVRDGEEKEEILLDHSFLSAYHLLNLIPLSDLDTQKKNIVQHAALAIVCHNYSEVINKYKFSDECKGKLEIGSFPICSLLSFCDNIQTWDRELDFDPLISRTESYDGLLERLILSDTAYISGSEINHISIEEDKGKYELMLRLKYFVESAKDAKKVCENLDAEILQWESSGKLRDVCELMGISSLLHGKIIYELPMLEDSYEIPF